MNPTSTVVGKELKNSLMNLARHEFQNKSYEILNGIYPTLKNAKNLGEIDRFGIDMYTTINNDDIDIIFQCKGNEISAFNNRHKKECLKSIKSFSDSNIVANKYFLVINRHIKDREITNEIESALSKLVSSGKTKKALLLTIDKFIKFIFIQIENLTRKAIVKANQRYEKDFNNRMDMKFYYKNVPFKLLNKKNTNQRNPIHYLINDLTSKSDLTYNKSIWYFIVSEFGFGKTSLLLNLYVNCTPCIGQNTKII